MAGLILKSRLSIGVKEISCICCNSFCYRDSSTRNISYISNRNRLIQNKSVLSVSRYNNESFQNIYSIQYVQLHSFLEFITHTFQSLAESSAANATKEALISFHNTTGLPWWSTIVMSTLLMRTIITLPLSLYQQYILAKVEIVTLELNEIVKELKKEADVAATLYNWTPQHAKRVYVVSLKKQWRLLIERENCHPLKSGIIVLFQVPFWVLMSLSLRNIVYMFPKRDEAAVTIFHELTNEGFIWINDLTVPDGTFIIPAVLCLINLSIVELHRLKQTKEPTRFQKGIIYFFRFTSLATFPFAVMAPSCLSLYWLTSSTFGLCQNLAVMSPKLKQIVGIPKTPSTMSNPYKHLWEQLQTNTVLKKLYKQ